MVMDQSILHAMLKEIVAFEIQIIRIEGKKMRQNKLPNERQSSINGLRTMNTPLSTAVADEMEIDK